MIADEHQDASALQDALVRRLGTVRLTVLADPMQLIHGFRGARIERLDAHREECDEELLLNTPHRWHGSEHLAEWLLAVRARLMGEEAEVARPAELHVVRTNAAHGTGPIKAADPGGDSPVARRRSEADRRDRHHEQRRARLPRLSHA